MSEGRDRIETGSQWTRTTSEFFTETQIQKQNEVTYATFKGSHEFQGRRIIMGISLQGRETKPTPPFRVEYVLSNPFSVFDARPIIEGRGTTHTGLTIGNDAVNKGTNLSYSSDDPTNIKVARMSFQSTEGEVKRLVIELNEPSTTQAVACADILVSGLLDYICFSKEIPISIRSVEVHEVKTNDLIELHVVLPYQQKVELDEQLLSGMLKVPRSLAPLLRLFREAVNSTNPYYRLLCLYRVGEGLMKQVRTKNNQRVRDLATAKKRPKQRIPENEFTKEFFSNWIGRSMDDYLKHVERNFRRLVAHVIVDEALNLLPDPGSSSHADQTDKINGMLISIIRQLIFDEWTFMKVNGIEDLP